MAKVIWSSQAYLPMCFQNMPISKLQAWWATWADWWGNFCAFSRNRLHHPNDCLFTEVLTSCLWPNLYWYRLNFIYRTVPAFSWLIFSPCHIDFPLYSLQIIREGPETFWQSAVFVLVYMSKALKMVMEKILISHDWASCIWTFGLASCIISKNTVPVRKYFCHSMFWECLYFKVFHHYSFFPCLLYYCSQSF